MAKKLIQSPFTSGTASSGVLTVAATQQYGLVVVSVWVTNPSTITSVTDDVGNTYTNAGTLVANSSTAIQQFYGVQTTAGARSITANFDSSNAYSVMALEFSGTAVSNALVYDVHGSATANGNSMFVTITPTSPAELVVAAFAGARTASIYTASNGYTSVAVGSSSRRVFYRLSAPSPTTPGWSWTGQTVNSSIVATAFNPPVPPSMSLVGAG